MLIQQQKYEEYLKSQSDIKRPLRPLHNELLTI